jgi:hypothetical protein
MRSANSPSRLVRPAVAAGSHPIETTHYVICTPPILLLHDVVRQLIENRVPGAVIHSKPRKGKTRAIKYLIKQLPQTFGIQIPILYALCKEYRIPSEGRFLGDLLHSLGHSMWESGKASAKQHRLVEHLASKVDQSNQDRLILFLDEAQKLHEDHYNWLIDIYNELDQRDIALTVLLVGQDELMQQLTAFEQAHKTQILGRFMVHRFEFRGLTSREDIKRCLEAYDEIDFPSESGWSYTSYFFPAAFQHGFRINSCAQDLWQAFKETKENYCLPGPLDVGMQYFCRTVEYIMKDNTTFGVQPTLSRKMWKEAIEMSGFVAADRYSQNQEHDEPD